MLNLTPRPITIRPEIQDIVKGIDEAYRMGSGLTYLKEINRGIERLKAIGEEAFPEVFRLRLEKYGNFVFSKGYWTGLTDSEDFNPNDNLDNIKIDLKNFITSPGLSKDVQAAARFILVLTNISIAIDMVDGSLKDASQIGDIFPNTLLPNYSAADQLNSEASVEFDELLADGFISSRDAIRFGLLKAHYKESIGRPNEKLRILLDTARWVISDNESRQTLDFGHLCCNMVSGMLSHMPEGLLISRIGSSLCSSLLPDHHYEQILAKSIVRYSKITQKKDSKVPFDELIQDFLDLDNEIQFINSKLASDGLQPLAGFTEVWAGIYAGIDRVPQTLRTPLFQEQTEELLVKIKRAAEIKSHKLLSDKPKSLRDSIINWCQLASVAFCTKGEVNPGGFDFKATVVKACKLLAETKPQGDALLWSVWTRFTEPELGKNNFDLKAQIELLPAIGKSCVLAAPFMTTKNLREISTLADLIPGRTAQTSAIRRAIKDNLDSVKRYNEENIAKLKALARSLKGA